MKLDKWHVNSILVSLARDVRLRFNRLPPLAICVFHEKCNHRVFGSFCVRMTIMLRTILVGLDGTEYSDAAVELGIAWAKRFDCLLVGVGVIDEPTVRGNQTGSRIPPSYKVAYDMLIKDARRQVHQFQEKFTMRCHEDQVACKLLEDEGLPDEQILLEAQRYDMVLLGSESHFRFETQPRHCQTLERVLRDACRPVVVVPKSDVLGREILVAYDGSVQAARTLHAFIATGLHELGDVLVVCVDSHSSVNAARTADRAVEFLRFHDVQATPCPIVS